MLRLQERFNQVAGRFKALLAFGLTIVLAAADYWDTVPLQPLLQELFGQNAATKLTVFLPIIFGTLRFISTNSNHWHEENH